MEGRSVTITPGSAEAWSLNSSHLKKWRAHFQLLSRMTDCEFCKFGATILLLAFISSLTVCLECQNRTGHDWGMTSTENCLSVPFTPILAVPVNLFGLGLMMFSWFAGDFITRQNVQVNIQEKCHQGMHLFFLGSWTLHLVAFHVWFDWTGTEMHAVKGAVPSDSYFASNSDEEDKTSPPPSRENWRLLRQTNVSHHIIYFHSIIHVHCTHFLQHLLYTALQDGSFQPSDFHCWKPLSNMGSPLTQEGTISLQTGIRSSDRHYPLRDMILASHR